MSKKRELTNTVWGLEFGGSAVRLVRVTRLQTGNNGPADAARTESGYRVDRFVQAPLDDRWASAPNLGAAVGGMRCEETVEPLAACMPDELTLYRALSLPEADTAPLEKMVQRQLEVFVPAGDEDLFVWGWQSAAHPFQAGQRNVLLCAARRDTAEQLTDFCKLLGDDSGVVVPSAMALAKLYAEMFPSEGECVALLDVAARSAAVVIVRGGDVLRCGAVDQGGDHWTDLIAAELGVSPEQAEKIKLEYLSNGTLPQAGAEALPKCIQRALAQWSRQLREVYQACAEDIPKQNRPSRCLIFGRAGRTPGLPEAVGKALGLRAEYATRPAGLSLTGDVPFEQAAAAIGAALCRLEQPRPAIDLAVRAKQKTRAFRKFSWRWAAVLVWLLAAVVFLYALDSYEAGWLERAAGRIRSSTAAHGGLERQLKIGGYLEMSAPAALAILDEISRLAPERLILTKWSYNRNGEVTLAGTVSSEKDFHTFLGKLQESRMLSDIEPRSHKKESGKFRFELALKAGPAVTRVTTAPATQPATTAPATKPSAATQPTSTAPAGERPESVPPEEPPGAATGPAETSGATTLPGAD